MHLLLQLDLSNRNLPSVAALHLQQMFLNVSCPSQLLIGPLIALAFGMSLVVLVMLTMLSLLMMEMLMFAVWFGLKLVFITIPAWIAKR